ncbi:hypothetical protein BDN71DRAFT_611842 [Pleurotus eryngii]|uniref:Uncharacterized protein n=1 Tax=Pleurotus eryngii TaxID=5323 RepID=A0A9P6A077_PLEER|nr:hypothetical protein BDN71DRAFT_611842 [Pleurotus eryngii]
MPTTTQVQVRPCAFAQDSASAQHDYIPKFAAHCASATIQSLEESPLFLRNPMFATPQIHLAHFIELLLRDCDMSVPAAMTTLTVINWMTEDGLRCPVASASPHHLFMATYQALLPFVTGMPRSIQPWRDVWDYMPISEVIVCRQEVQAFLPTLNEGECALLKILASQDTIKTIDYLYDLELLQDDNEQWDSEEGEDNMEEDIVSPGIVYEQDSESDSESTFPTTPVVEVYEPWPAKKVPITHRVWRRVRRVSPRIARAFGLSNKS